MIQEIGEEMEEQTHALSLAVRPQNGDEVVWVLDLCMAPGGYSTDIMRLTPNARIRGISLPKEHKGYELCLPVDYMDGRKFRCDYFDITMLYREFGLRFEDIPQDHPEKSKFVSAPLFPTLRFQLAICDGQLLPESRRRLPRDRLIEANRLRTAQLIVAMQRLTEGGTLILLLHKVDAWDTVLLLHQFSKFATVELFKSEWKFTNTNGFYLIAKNVRPQEDAAKDAVKVWKEEWRHTTIGGANGLGEAVEAPNREAIETVLEKFGSRLIELARPIWAIQTEGLKRKLNAHHVASGQEEGPSVTSG